VLFFLSYNRFRSKQAILVVFFFPGKRLNSSFRLNIHQQLIQKIVYGDDNLAKPKLAYDLASGKYHFVVKSE
jgi:hypothetical protein